MFFFWFKAAHPHTPVPPQKPSASPAAHPSSGSPRPLAPQPSWIRAPARPAATSAIDDSALAHPACPSLARNPSRSQRRHCSATSMPTTPSWRRSTPRPEGGQPRAPFLPRASLCTRARSARPLPAGHVTARVPAAVAAPGAGVGAGHGRAARDRCSVWRMRGRSARPHGSAVPFHGTRAVVFSLQPAGGGGGRCRGSWRSKSWRGAICRWWIALATWPTPLWRFAGEEGRRDPGRVGGPRLGPAPAAGPAVQRHLRPRRAAPGRRPAGRPLLAGRCRPAACGGALPSAGRAGSERGPRAAALGRVPQRRRERRGQPRPCRLWCL